MHYTFNTPTPTPAAPALQCGRVLYSDFHVSIGNTNGVTFPNECNASALTPQEKVLAYFLFDLASCVSSVVSARVRAEDVRGAGPRLRSRGRRLRRSARLRPLSSGSGVRRRRRAEPVRCTGVHEEDLRGWPVRQARRRLRRHPRLRNCA